MQSFWLYNDNSLPSLPPGYVAPSQNVDELPEEIELQLESAVAQLEKIAHMQIQLQENEIKTCLVALKICLELFSNQRSYFTITIVKKILHAMPKLPVDTAQFQKLLRLLLDRAYVLAEKNEPTRQYCAVMLNALAKLNVNLLNHDALVTLLLAPFDTMRFTSSTNNPSNILLSQLWQFCAFASAKKYKQQEMNRLLPFIEKIMEATELSAETSFFQDAVINVLRKVLTNAAMQELVQNEEYRVAVYSLDIAFVSKKLNIEVDGPHHYRGEELTRHSEFRDYLLEEYCHWSVLRIPFFKWNALKGEQGKIDYMIKLLAKHTDLLDAAAITRLAKLDDMTLHVKAKNIFVDVVSEVPAPEKVARTKKDVVPSKKFLDSTRFLNIVFSSHVSANSAWKYNEDEKTFQTKPRFHKSHRAEFKAIAKASRLDISFVQSVSERDYYRVKVAKASKGLKKAKAIIATTGFFNHDETLNDNSQIVNLICEYGNKK
jgi:very-short-patch-repair endonuclease